METEGDATSSTLDGTFCVDESQSRQSLERPAQLAQRVTRASRSRKGGVPQPEERPKRGARNTYCVPPSQGGGETEGAGEPAPPDSSLEGRSGGDENDTVDDSQTEETSLSSSALKRRSGEDPCDRDTSHERRKKRKRTLLCASNTQFFPDLDIS